MTDDVTREQVLAFRATRHQFDRSETNLLDLAALDLGIQVSNADTGATALAARLPEAPDLTELRSAWTFRGAPHLHRPDELVRLAKALWPRSDADAEARLGGMGPELRKDGFSAVEAIHLTAEVTAEALAGHRGDDDAMTKGELSTAISKELPDHLLRYCRSCKTEHVNEQLMRVSMLPGGGRIVPGPPPVRFTKLERWRAIPKKPAGTADLVRAYLRLLGPARKADVAGFLMTTAKELEPIWPDGLAGITYDGRQGWLAEEDVQDLQKADAPDVVRLLPPLDPYLQLRDRDLLVPDKAHQKEIWKVLGNPGTVLVGAEVVGTWRAKKSAKKLTVTVSPFAELTKKAAKELEVEAERLAALRGTELAKVAGV
jgi:hypothetical protein